jgi:hypothetical protein
MIRASRFRCADSGDSGAAAMGNVPRRPVRQSLQVIKGIHGVQKHVPKDPPLGRARQLISRDPENISNGWPAFMQTSFCGAEAPYQTANSALEIGDLKDSCPVRATIVHAGAHRPGKLKVWGPHRASIRQGARGKGKFGGL